MRQLAAARGGKCMSTAYVNSTTKLVWKCAKGHRWTAVPSSVARGTWCPECAGRRRMSISHMQLMAFARGGKCISTVYEGSPTKVIWECAKGHQWSALPSMVARGSWCPRCVGKGKTIEEMQAMAALHGGRCVSARYLGSKTELQWECKKGHRFTSKPEYVRIGTWCQKCRPPLPTIADMREIARRRRGKCLSKRYVNDSTHLRWRCREGHTWGAQPNSIKAGSWCPICAFIGVGQTNRTPYTTEDMHKFAAAHGGEFLSGVYRGIHEPHQWRCARGHAWKTSASAVRKGHWCRKCVAIERTTRVRFVPA